MERLLTVEEVAGLSGWNIQTVYAKARVGLIPGKIKLGGSVRFQESAIQKWLAGETSNETLEGRHTRR